MEKLDAAAAVLLISLLTFPAASYAELEWLPMESGTMEDLFALWGSSGTNVFAAGDRGTVLHYDGSSWTPLDSGTEKNLRGIWGSSAANVFAVGFDGTILRYDGSSWSDLDSGIETVLLGIWGSSGTEVFAVGIFGTILRSEPASTNGCQLTLVPATVRSPVFLPRAVIFRIAGESIAFVRGETTASFGTEEIRLLSRTPLVVSSQRLVAVALVA